MNTPWKKIAAAAAIVIAAPASAIPITFDLSGTISNAVDIDFGTGMLTPDISRLGLTFNAQFVLETDLFGTGVSSSADIGDRLSYSTGLPGAMTGSLVIDGTSIDLTPYSPPRANAGFLDSNGVVSGPGGARLAPDQFNLNLSSDSIGAFGPTALRTVSFSYVAPFAGFENPELAMSWFELSPDFDITQIAFLPLAGVQPSLHLSDYRFACADDRCQQTGVYRTSFSVTSATRTVASVPEPGTLGLLALGIAGVFAARRRHGARA